MANSLPSLITFVVLSIAAEASAPFPKRSFSALGCMGVYDKAKFARLDRVCEECYQLYRESDVHTLCRWKCFKNDFFTQCVDALLLKNEQPEIADMVKVLYGRRK